MTVLQAWVLVGIPGIVLAISLFYGRSRVRTFFGYGVLVAVTVLMATVDRASAAAVGGFVALLYAAGRGGTADAEGYNSSLMAVPDDVRLPVRRRTG